MYYVIEITTTDKAAKAVYSYDTLEKAVATFHSQLGGWMKNETCQTELVMVIDDNGAVHRAEKYTRPVAVDVPEAQAEPAEEPTE